MAGAGPGPRYAGLARGPGARSGASTVTNGGLGASAAGSAARARKTVRERTRLRRNDDATERGCMTRLRLALLFLSVLPSFRRLSAQSHVDGLALRFSSMTAVTGLEQAMGDSLFALLPGSTRDRAGNITLTLGQGAPKRLLTCPLDEVGYVVGNILPDGYLLLRRVGGGGGGGGARCLRGARDRRPVQAQRAGHRGDRVHYAKSLLRQCRPGNGDPAARPVRRDQDRQPAGQVPGHGGGDGGA